MWEEVVSGMARLSGRGATVSGMAATGTRQSARARARAANQAVIAARRVRDEANMVSLTDYFAAADAIEASRLTMARAISDIRDREGTVTAAAALAGITLGDARKLLALLADTNDDTTDDTGAGENGTEPSRDSGDTVHAGAVEAS